MLNLRTKILAMAVAGTLFGIQTASANKDNNSNEQSAIQHVLLISVDGMHEVDLANYLAKHSNSAFARLINHGVRYTHVSTSNPSDSFPGLLAFMTGGSPKSTGVFYDDSYDRTLFAPGSNCLTMGTETQYAENIDYDLSQLDGGGLPDSDHIDPTKLPLQLVNGICQPVYPHNFLKVNTVMEVIHDSGMRTAWSDKHPAYEIVSGKTGTGLDELYAPEINSVTVHQFIPTAPTDAVWTDKPEYTRVYDKFKVDAVIQQINGRDHTGNTPVGVPAIFGMNFQSVSVGQKVTADGYISADAKPSDQLELSFKFVDQSLGRMLDALDQKHLLDSTVIIVGAKHGQSPIDVAKLHMLIGSTNPKVPTGQDDVVDPAKLLNNNGIMLAQETSDDVALLWLDDQKQLNAALKVLKDDQNGPNSTRIEKIYANGPLVSKFGNPKFGRTPDIIIQPIQGTIYSKSAKKIAEHGGFAEDDTHTLLVISNPNLKSKQVNKSVTNMQVAPTILQLLGLNPKALEAVRMEHTELLPSLELDN
jgi:hypothetical protein